MSHSVVSNEPFVASDKPLRELLVLAVPTVLQMASYTIEQFIGVKMLSSVSDLSAAAVGNASMVVFSVISFGFGVLVLLNALISQSFGAGRFEETGRYLWQGLWLGAGYSVLAVVVAPFVEPVFRLMGHSDALVALEHDYFVIAASLIGIKLFAVALGEFLVAINRPIVVFVAAGIGVLAALASNYVLIFGHFGLPAMGVKGAAWGVNIGVAVELLILALFVFGRQFRARYHTLAWRFEAKKFVELLRVGLPSGFQVAGDVLAWTLFMNAVMGRFGEHVMAANTYMMQYMKISFMPAFGIGAAVTALVGRYVGAGMPDVSVRRAHLGFRVTMVYMLTCGLAFLLLRNVLIGLFSDNPEVIRMGGTLMIFCAVFQLFDAMFVIYIGALRGVKDTFVPSLVQIALTWGLVVGGGWWVATRYPQWGIIGPWALACLYGLTLGLFLMIRFSAGGWKRTSVAAA